MTDFSSDADAIEAGFPSVASDPQETNSYARSQRIKKTIGLIFGSSLLAETGWLCAQRLPSEAWASALACMVAGLILADGISGMVHWAADSYGHARMPIFGGFVRTFRAHHSDQLGITRHDAIEANGDVFIFSSPVHFVLLFLVDSPWLLALIFGVFLGSYCNSQIHKWAHTAQPPSLVRYLQRARVFLFPTHHARHHSGSHESHYCITTGWLNPVLDGTRFFRGAEIVLERIGIRRTN